MSRCLTCKHWGTRDIASKSHPAILAQCGHPKHLYLSSGDQSDFEVASSSLVADDDTFGLLTGPDFGCVNYEKKK